MPGHALRLLCPQGEGDAMQESMEALLYEHGVDMIFSGEVGEGWVGGIFWVCGMRLLCSSVGTRCVDGLAACLPAVCFVPDIAIY